MMHTVDWLEMLRRRLAVGHGGTTALPRGGLAIPSGESARRGDHELGEAKADLMRTNGGEKRHGGLDGHVSRDGVHAGEGEMTMWLSL